MKYESAGKKLRLVIVEWTDIAGSSATYWLGDETPDVANIVSVGWIVEETKTKLTIAQSVADDGDFGAVTTMPMAVVKRIRRVR